MCLRLTKDHENRVRYFVIPNPVLKQVQHRVRDDMYDDSGGHGGLTGRQYFRLKSTYCSGAPGERLNCNQLTGQADCKTISAGSSTKSSRFVRFTEISFETPGSSMVTP